MAINLLTQELKPNTYVSGFSKNLKKVAVVAGIIFVVSGVVLTISILVLSSRINSSVTQQQTLKAQIAALEQTEQKLILIKDRLSKIGSVLAADDAYDEVVVLEGISRITPEDILIKDAKLEEGSLEIAFISQNLGSISSFFRSLKSLGVRSIKQKSFEFVPEIGYQIRLEISK